MANAAKNHQGTLGKFGLDPCAHPEQFYQTASYMIKPPLEYRPLLMSGKFVPAVLSGEKTQMRRPMNPQPSKGVVSVGPSMARAGWLEKLGCSDSLGVLTGKPREWTMSGNAIKCPFGAVGDRLWICETWAPASRGVQSPLVDATYACFPDGSQKFKSGEYYPWTKPVGPTAWPNIWRWRPSIHMPRWASRITLEITEIRVQRLNEISEENAKAEGIKVLRLQSESDPSAWYESAPGVHQDRSPRGSFARLWDSIYGKKYPWKNNDWVWSISFKRVEAAR